MMHCKGEDLPWQLHASDKIFGKCAQLFPYHGAAHGLSAYQNDTVAAFPYVIHPRQRSGIFLKMCWESTIFSCSSHLPLNFNPSRLLTSLRALTASSSLIHELAKPFKLCVNMSSAVPYMIQANLEAASLIMVAHAARRQDCAKLAKIWGKLDILNAYHPWNPSPILLRGECCLRIC